jgi:hypothetical protein
MSRNQKCTCKTVISVAVLSAVLVASFVAISFVQQALAQGNKIAAAGGAMANTNATANKTAGSNMIAAAG